LSSVAALFSRPCPIPPGAVQIKGERRAGVVDPDPRARWYAAPVKHTVVHHADVATARRAAEAALASYQERYPGYHPAAVWTTEEHADISFQVKGVHLRGAI